MRYFIYLTILFVPVWTRAQYTGTGSVTQGKASTTINNLYTCPGGRMAGLGTIKATDNTDWTVPALTNFKENTFPFSSDLYNSCIGADYSSAEEALAALSGNDIIAVDQDGELITAYIFADNYFELYINGMPVGKDKVPFTQFNSSIVRFIAKRPFTVAMLLVDWEENLGLGSEQNGGYAYHPGDGGVVAVFRDSDNKTIGLTNKDWKAQTFYTSPVTDLSCPKESGTKRLSDQCSTQDSNNGLSYYGLHWKRPEKVMDLSFDDSDWPNATTFTNAEIGVDNKPAYTNFTEIFDEPVHDAQFIWSSNVVLDNEVIVRYKVPAPSLVEEYKDTFGQIKVTPNPSSDIISIHLNQDHLKGECIRVTILNPMGITVLDAGGQITGIDISSLPAGIYIVQITEGNRNSKLKILKK